MLFENGPGGLDLGVERISHDKNPSQDHMGGEITQGGDLVGLRGDRGFGDHHVWAVEQAGDQVRGPACRWLPRPWGYGIVVFVPVRMRSVLKSDGFVVSSPERLAPDECPFAGGIDVTHDRAVAGFHNRCRSRSEGGVRHRPVRCS